jgi:hypothetical protein
VILAKILLAPILMGTLAWACAALWFDGSASQLLSGLLSVGFAAAVLAVWLRVRPLRRALAVHALLFVFILGWWSLLPPSNDRDWEPSVARPPRAELDGDQVRISNLRDFDYQSETDFTERWETRTYDLSQVVGVDIFLSYWGSPWIAHTIMSWAFADGRQLAVSIETRKERHESYSAVLGFFRQFELYYVVADERDVVRLRTNYRDEDVYLYHLHTRPETARALLEDYLEEINRLAGRPKWYNALTHNCTTVIRRHVQHVAPGNPFNWRILVNGVIDELGYMRGTIDTSLPFEELRRRSNVNQAARAADDDPAFSLRIREGLPGGHGG